MHNFFNKMYFSSLNVNIAKKDQRLSMQSTLYTFYLCIN